MHLNHYENPYSRLAQHMSCAGANMVHCPGYADDLRQYTTLNKNDDNDDDDVVGEDDGDDDVVARSGQGVRCWWRWWLAIIRGNGPASDQPGPELNTAFYVVVKVMMMMVTILAKICQSPW